MAKNSCRLSLLSQTPPEPARRSSTKVFSQPRKRQPETLIKKVPHGKTAPTKCSKVRDVPKRSKPPRAEPSATRVTCQKACISILSLPLYSKQKKHCTTNP